MVSDLDSVSSDQRASFGQNAVKSVASFPTSGEMRTDELNIF